MTTHETDPPCEACAIEQRIRTDRVPHPIDPSIHSCDLMSRRGFSVEYDFTCDKGLLTVFAPYPLFTYDGWIMRIAWMGGAFPAMNLPVTKVVRYRDGGTTYVHCDAGVLYSPTPSKGGCATWKDAAGVTTELTRGTLTRNRAW